MAENQNTEKKPSDEEMRKRLLPNPSEEQLIAAVTKSFAKAGQTVSIVKKLESYDDKNFWVDIGGTHYLAKWYVQYSWTTTTAGCAARYLEMISITLISLICFFSIILTQQYL